MADTQRNYDWALHFRTREYLGRLDQIHRLIHNKNFPQDWEGTIFQTSFNKAANAKPEITKGMTFGEMLEHKMQKVTSLAGHHAVMAGERARAFNAYLEDAVKCCWNKDWNADLQQEVESCGAEIESLYTGIENAQPVFDGEVIFEKGKAAYAGALTAWMSGLLDISAARLHYKTMNILPGPPGPSPYDGASANVVSRKLGGHLEKLARLGLDHAVLMTSLAEECLSLAATIDLLPLREIKKAFTAKARVMEDTGCNVMISALLELDGAARTRNRVVLSREVGRLPFRPA